MVGEDNNKGDCWRPTGVWAPDAAAILIVLFYLFIFFQKLRIFRHILVLKRAFKWLKKVC